MNILIFINYILSPIKNIHFFAKKHASVLYFVLVFYFICINCQNLIKPKLSYKNSKVFGPGLEANFTVPVRYFFIQLLDTENNSYTSSPQSLTIQVSGLEQKCRIWYQLLNIDDSMFVARYRLYETCFGVQIDIIFDDKMIADAPYIINEKLFYEQCYCPRPISEWLSSLSCPSSYPQIKKDLHIFPEIDMKDVMTDALKRFNHPSSYSICHYSIVSNQIYRKCYGQYVGFSMFMDEILLSLARKFYLPDMELLSNLGDWPLEQRSVNENPIPIFSWCGSKQTRDIVMPTYDITESTLEMMGRVMLDMLSVMGNSGPTWMEKKPIAFWRGRDSRQERLDLIKLAREHPHLINASLINFFFFRKEEEEYGPKTEYVSFFEFFKYRYQINIDGTVAAYRMPYLLAGNSLVLKQDSDFYEHFYGEMEPMVHYIPFNRNLSNLIETLQWAIGHDREAKQIAENARQFALSHLMPKDILCYYATLLKDYAKRLKSKSEVHEDMELVKQPEEKNCFCLENLERKVNEEL